MYGSHSSVGSGRGICLSISHASTNGNTTKYGGGYTRLILVVTL